MIPTVSFIGHHDSGKTCLIAQLIPLFIERGYRVGTVKHAPRLGEIDEAGSDSAVHLAAGADRVLLHGNAGSALFWRHDGPVENGFDELFPQCDLILIEGLKHGPFPKIEVFRRGADFRRQPLAGEVETMAVVTSDRVTLPDDVKLLSPRRPAEIVEFIEAYFAEHEPTPIAS